MKIYFALSSSMIEKYGMPERSVKPGTYTWLLQSGTCLFDDIGSDLGQFINKHLSDIENENQNDEDVLICQADIREEVFIGLLQTALAQGRSELTENVVVTKIIKIEKEV